MLPPTIKEVSVSPKFELGISRVNTAISAGLLSVVTAGGLALSLTVPAMSVSLLPATALIGLLSLPFINQCFRKQPLMVIDSQGIRDFGLFTRGFGLIEWRNIESVRIYRDKGEFLLIKVNNLDDLLERRNVFLKPLLWINCKFSAILGGEICVSLSYGNAKPSDVLEHVSAISRQSLSGRDVAVPKQSVFKDFLARLQLMIIILLMLLFVGFFGYNGYLRWMSHQSPVLKISGSEVPFPSNTTVGKQSWLDGMTVYNNGGNAKGIRIELSGKALETGFLKDPKVLVDYENEKQDTSSSVTQKTRELVTLHQVSNGLWIGDCASAQFPRKEDDFLLGLKLFSLDSIGWYTDINGRCLRLNFFAQISKPSSGNLTIKVVPTGHESKAVSQTKMVTASHNGMYNLPICSAKVPKNYPITLYPGSQIIWLSNVELKFDSADKGDQIANYYRTELTQRGWKVSTKKEKGSNQQTITGKQGQKTIVIEINNLKSHTPVLIAIRSAT